MAAQLVGGHVDSSVNNPIEAVAQWRGGELRHLCVFDTEKLAYDEPVADGKAWSDVPLCSESGLDIDYLMLRGIFTTPGASEEEVAYYVDLLEKVRATPDWQEFIAKGAFKHVHDRRRVQVVAHRRERPAQRADGEGGLPRAVIDHRQPEPVTGEGTVPVWWVELGVAGALALVGALVIADSLRVGIGWGLEGPQAGFFPFYVGLILFASSACTFALNLVPARRDTGNFVERSSLSGCLPFSCRPSSSCWQSAGSGFTSRVPCSSRSSCARSAASRLVRSVGVGAAIAVALFVVFEIWFLMPLPKGPLEAALGY